MNKLEVGDMVLIRGALRVVKVITEFGVTVDTVSHQSGGSDGHWFAFHEIMGCWRQEGYVTREGNIITKSSKNTDLDFTKVPT